MRYLLQYPPPGPQKKAIHGNLSSTCELWKFIEASFHWTDDKEANDNDCKDKQGDNSKHPTPVAAGIVIGSIYGRKMMRIARPTVLKAIFILVIVAVGIEMIGKGAVTI